MKSIKDFPFVVALVLGFALAVGYNMVFDVPAQGMARVYPFLVGVGPLVLVLVAKLPSLLRK